jgi:hypothetical protein
MADPGDARASPRLTETYPGVRTVFDAAAMADVLGHGLGVPVGACEPGEALLEADGYCMVRQRVTLAATGARLVLSVRLFGDAAAAEAFLAGPLAHPVDDLDGRSHRPAVPVLAAVVPQLSGTFSVFPVDGELPALVPATDPSTVAPLLRGFVPGAEEALTVTPVHYARRRRCVLRYDTGDPRAVAYGKLANDGGGSDTAAVTEALRARPVGFDVPPVLAADPGRGVVILGGISGMPLVAPLLEARIRGGDAPPGAPALETAVSACGRAAAGLHELTVELATTRTLAGELSAVGELLDLARRYSPAVADHLDAAVARIEVARRATAALPLVTAHGDFSYTQLLFAGERAGLVDFDGVCRAEPALDLGHFLAYLRFAVVKAAATRTAEHAALEDRLATMFLDGYHEASGARCGRDALDARVATYEAVSLVRLALHAWQKLKPTRLARIVTVLDQRLARLPT